MTDFIFLGFKITVGADCSPEIKALTPWKETDDRPRQCAIKQRHHFANKGQYSPNDGFSSVLSCSVMSDCLWPQRLARQSPLSMRCSRQESWSGLPFLSPGFSCSHALMWELDHKEGWALRSDAFDLWCSRGLLGVPWTARRSNRSSLKEYTPEYSLKGLMQKLKL